MKIYITAVIEPYMEKKSWKNTQIIIIIHIAIVKEPCIYKRISLDASNSGCNADVIDANFYQVKRYNFSQKTML